MAEYDANVLHWRNDPEVLARLDEDTVCALDQFDDGALEPRLAWEQLDERVQAEVLQAGREPFEVDFVENDLADGLSELNYIDVVVVDVPGTFSHLSDEEQVIAWGLATDEQLSDICHNELESFMDIYSFPARRQ